MTYYAWWIISFQKCALNYVSFDVLTELLPLAPGIRLLYIIIIRTLNMH